MWRIENGRRPAEPRPPRMEALARLPVFLALDARRVVVAGNGPAAAWKAELLSAAGAEVEVFADNPCEELRAVATQPPRGAIMLHDRTWQAPDFAGAAVAVGGFDDDPQAQRFAAAARAAGVPVNVIDKPAHGDFSFGAIVNRSPLVIGISTDGAAPVFAQAIRARFEAMIPRGFARWADAAWRWRAAVQSAGLSFAARGRFWQAFTSFAVTHPDREPAQADFDAFLAKSRNESRNESRNVARNETRGDATAADAGSVTLVGAGPGDPELLTLRAVRALQSADIILIDDLVAPEILDFARREAKKMLVGKTGYGPSCKQDEINALMIRLAKAGKRVVRLKGGDPMIFGRAGEEIAACRAAGISIEVVPGITAAQGAAARLAAPLTQRRDSRRLQYVTGHGENGRLPQDLDWASLADPAATTVVYMPKRTIGELAARAMASGLAPDTPAVAVAAATRPDEVVVAGTVADIGAKLAAAPLPGPVLVFIGRVFEAVCVNDGRDSISTPSAP
ncbi:MAG: uroporphyrin-III C-methyltransferase / precorrin-2 dehydrogenase / sirohydrochlorin ferrochelatase, partial [Alphaproteobacteria bacterium]|nr:uroporphyrin-III C-methyltransferase / precorrin-2 dehydrogenase / sirohydrochlorin ferrochelatase [Alphaproteobacteria bacterium]